jgi:hypothetical protein
MGNDIYEIRDRLCMELAEVNNNIKRNNSMDSSTLEVLDKLTHAMKSVETIIAMWESKNSSNYYDRGNSGGNYGYSGGMYDTKWHPNMPNMSNGGLYGHDSNTIAELRTIMNSTSDERTRQGISNLLNTMSR